MLSASPDSYRPTHREEDDVCDPRRDGERQRPSNDLEGISHRLPEGARSREIGRRDLMPRAFSPSCYAAFARSLTGAVAAQFLANWTA